MSYFNETEVSDSIMKKKLTGFGELGLDKKNFLQSMGLCCGCEYEVVYSQSQVMLLNALSETIIVPQAVMSLLEWLDD